jgi:hypothetical protein
MSITRTKKPVETQRTSALCDGKVSSAKPSAAAEAINFSQVRRYVVSVFCESWRSSAAAVSRSKTGHLKKGTAAVDKEH